MDGGGTALSTPAGGIARGKRMSRFFAAAAMVAELEGAACSGRTDSGAPQPDSGGPNPNVVVDGLDHTQCWPRPMTCGEPDPSEPKATAIDTCLLLEARSAQPCTCPPPMLAPASGSPDAAVRSNLARTGRTDLDCICELVQARGEALYACQFDVSTSPVVPSTGAPATGWCYIDPAQGWGAAGLVAECAEHQKRMLRFLGREPGAAGAEVFMACLGVLCVSTDAGQ